MKAGRKHMNGKILEGESLEKTGTGRYPDRNGLCGNHIKFLIFKSDSPIHRSPFGNYRVSEVEARKISGFRLVMPVRG